MSVQLHVLQQQKWLLLCTCDSKVRSTCNTEKVSGVVQKCRFMLIVCDFAQRQSSYIIIFLFKYARHQIKLAFQLRVRKYLESCAFSLRKVDTTSINRVTDET